MLSPPSIRSPPPRILDIGCGWDARFLRHVEPMIASGVGIDFKAPNYSTDKIQCMQVALNQSLPFANSDFDAVVMLAVLEHLQYPESVLKECLRVLQPNGLLIGTVPSKIAKPVLEFLAYRLHILNENEIRDHKTYFNRQSLRKILIQSGFSDIHHRYFQLGMNNFFTCRKG